MPKYELERSQQINATPEAVFDCVSNFNTWTSWSPWLCAEPDAKVLIEGDGKSVGPIHMAGIRSGCHFSEIGTASKAAFDKARHHFKEAGLPTDQGMVSVYHRFDVKAARFDFTAGYLLPSKQPQMPDSLLTWSLPATQAIKVVHLGAFEHLGNGWSAAHQYARHKKLKQSKIGTFEIYENSPSDTPRENLRAAIYLPLK